MFFSISRHDKWVILYGNYCIVYSWQLILVTRFMEIEVFCFVVDVLEDSCELETVWYISHCMKVIFSFFIGKELNDLSRYLNVFSKAFLKEARNCQRLL